ncbi:MAG: MOSC N-terminal beta barrel domain-containing protein [Pseudomonadota bacterium]
MSDVAGRITGLFVYPIKGCAAVALAETIVERRGLAHDRRWAVATPSGRVLTQREHPRLARVHCGIKPDDGLDVQIDGVRLPAPSLGTGTMGDVRIWRDSVIAECFGGPLGEAFSALLGVPVQLVHFPETTVREVDRHWAPAGGETAFTDGFPLLVTNEATLVQLDEQLVELGAEPVPMSRFRPNVVVADMPAGAEDDHGELRADSGLILDLVKPSERCIVLTIDQETGEPHGDQPLAILRQTRRHPVLKQPVFGQNAVPRLTAGATGRLHVGSHVVLAGSGAA